MTDRPITNTGRLRAAPAIADPTATPTNPYDIAERRAIRSTIRPTSGADNDSSSVIASPTPNRPSEIPRPEAMVARNGTANR